MSRCTSRCSIINSHGEPICLTHGEISQPNPAAMELVRIDALQAGRTHERFTDGCHVHPHCLACPRPRCVFDDAVYNERPELQHRPLTTPTMSDAEERAWMARPRCVFDDAVYNERPELQHRPLTTPTMSDAEERAWMARHAGEAR